MGLAKATRRPRETDGGSSYDVTGKIAPRYGIRAHYRIVDEPQRTSFIFPFSLFDVLPQLFSGRNFTTRPFAFVGGPDLRHIDLQLDTAGYGQLDSPSRIVAQQDVRDGITRFKDPSVDIPRECCEFRVVLGPHATAVSGGKQAFEDIWIVYFEEFPYHLS